MELRIFAIPVLGQKMTILGFFFDLSSKFILTEFLHRCDPRGGNDAKLGSGEGRWRGYTGNDGNAPHTYMHIFERKWVFGKKMNLSPLTLSHLTKKRPV